MARIAWARHALQRKLQECSKRKSIKIFSVRIGFCNGVHKVGIASNRWQSATVNGYWDSVQIARHGLGIAC